MPRKRRVPELCDGAGGVSDTGEPGPGGGHGGVRIVVHAHDRSGVRDYHATGSIVANEDVCEFGDARSALCCADDAAHGGLATLG